MVTGKPLVVGVDGSGASARALRWALQEARQRGVPVHAIMVWRSHAVLAGPGPLLLYPELAPHHVHEHHQQELARVARECLGAASTPELHTQLVQGHPVDELVHHSIGAAMLVLGDRGRHHTADTVLGTTAYRCIRYARCPVLIIPTGVAFNRPASEQEQDQSASHDPVLS